MQFAVIARATDTSSLPPQAQVALPKKTFEMLASRQEPRIKAVYPFAGERAGIFLIEVDTADELQEVMGGLPLAPLVRMEVHPVGTVQSTLKTLERAEQSLAELVAAGTARR